MGVVNLGHPATNDEKAEEKEKEFMDNKGYMGLKEVKKNEVGEHQANKYAKTLDMLNGSIFKPDDRLKEILIK